MVGSTVEAANVIDWSGIIASLEEGREAVIKDCVPPLATCVAGTTKASVATKRKAAHASTKKYLQQPDVAIVFLDGFSFQTATGRRSEIGAKLANKDVPYNGMYVSPSSSLSSRSAKRHETRHSSFGREKRKRSEANRKRSEPNSIVNS